jgi:uncharacterized protein involved in response to NO
VVLARGFRPFFLLAGLYGSAFLLFWLCVLAGLLPAPRGLVPSWWHAHEMVFGFVCAAVAGFLLTSVPVWTGTPAVSGRPLGGLVALWVLGRIAMALSAVLPAPWVAIADLAFLPALAVAIGRPLVATRQRRNLGFPAVLGVLALANLAFHLESTGRGAFLGIRVAVYFVTVLVVIVGGRIVPAFTRNALLRAGIDAPPRSIGWADRLAVPAVLLVAVTDLARPVSLWSGGAALLAAVVLISRMSGWQSSRTLRDPLVWVLHVGYAWIPFGFACMAVSDLTWTIPRTSGLHALTSGAFGTMILAVMSRVPLGHTGRPLAAPRPMQIAYCMVAAGALLRVAAPIVAPAGLPLLLLAGVLWAGAFVLFTATYWPILTRPRVDGLPG